MADIEWHEDEAVFEIDRAITAVVHDGADKVFEEAVNKCPVGKNAREGTKYRSWKKRVPGSLKKSGRINKFKNTDGAGAYIQFGGEGYVVGEVDTYYGIFVEYDRQFLRKALKKHRRRILAGVRKVLENEL